MSPPRILEGYMKECGGCTWCCYFMEVHEFNSPEYKNCTNCVTGSGCSVWAERPEVCRNTSCVWFNEEQIPDAFRPDKCNVMFELPPACDVYVGHVNPNMPDAWKEPIAQVFINKIKESGHSVVICTYDKSKTYYSLVEGDTVERVKNQLIKSIDTHKNTRLL